MQLFGLSQWHKFYKIFIIKIILQTGYVLSVIIVYLTSGIYREDFCDMEI